jgi:AAA+ ATPase superfamily predicted ATPase
LTIEELGRNYGRYFSILEAIAGGHTQWNNIATQSGVPHNSLGKYLDELVNYYGLVERKASVFSRDSSKTSRYYLHDNFLTFWFRYVYKYSSLLAEFSADRILPKVRRDLPNFFGFQFEKFVKSWLSWQAGAHPDRFPFDHIGTYWDKGENEIDVVAYQEDGGLCLVGECKWNSKRITAAIIDQLNTSVEVIQRKRKFKKFQKTVFVGDHLSPSLKEKLLKQDIRVFEMRDYWK